MNRGSGWRRALSMTVGRLVLAGCLGCFGGLGCPGCGDGGAGTPDAAEDVRLDEARDGAGDGAAASGDASAADGVAPKDDAGGADVAGGGGACTNADDGSIVGGETGLDVDVEVPKCVRALLMGGSGPADDDFADRVGACLTDATGLTGPCAGCYAANADCGADGCLALCIVDPDARDCVDCRCGRSGKPNCIQAFVDCSGVPDGTCE